VIDHSTSPIAPRRPSGVGPDRQGNRRAERMISLQSPEWIASSVMRRAWIRQMTLVSRARCSIG
jgi:hypothetical protein